jgi:REP element-mobilizing transposase RayT
MLRGVDRLPIFLDDVDREDFLRRLSQLIPELGFRCFAWALMPNHVHLLVRSGSARISQLMARLGTGYARRFNERHDRVGHLFQNRFRSRRAIDDADLIGLVLYVTRNPLAAGLVGDPATLERFPWCGLGALVGRRAGLPFEAIAETLALFDGDPGRARQLLRLRLGALEGAADLHAPTRPSASAASVPAALTEFEVLQDEVCERFHVTRAALCSRRRSQQLAAARSALAVRATRELGLNGAEIGRRLGLTKAAVSAMLTRRNAANNLTF